MKILLIEDDALLRNGLQKALEQQQYCCDTACNLSEARLHSLDEYDLAILDLGLPDGDGSGLLKQWRQILQHKKTTITSNRSADHEYGKF